MDSFQRLYNLFEEELYDNVTVLAKFYLTNPMHFYLNKEEIFGCYIFMALR